MQPTGRWQRFLTGRTSWQRFVLQVSALVTAAVTIGGAGYGGWTVLGGLADRGGDRSAVEGQGLIDNGSDAATALVQLLVDSGRRSTPVQLDHRIRFGGIRDNQLALQYGCERQGGCRTVTLVDHGPAARTVAGAADVRWFEGCWTVRPDDTGPGAGPGLDVNGLKLTLVRIGRTCPG